MKTLDQAIESFEKLKNELSNYLAEDLSESDTRSKVLDVILKDVLGWSESEIKREGSTETGYYDYRITTPSFQFVVEAKKTFAQFKLPKNHTKATIKSIEKHNIDIVSQVRGYLFGEGLVVAVLSNGSQFIIGQFVQFDGSDWREHQCLIFNGLDDIEKRFIDFYNLLSRDIIVEQGGIKFTQNNYEFSKTLASSLSDKNRELIRNNLSASLRLVIDEVFGEIYKYEELDNKELMEYCFVKNQETKKNQDEIQRLFDDKAPRLSGIIPIRDTDKTIRTINQEISEYPIEQSMDLAPPKPIIIIGAKGAGKTTFINYLFKFNEDEQVKKHHPIVYTDFIKYDITEDRKAIISDILNSLEENYPALNLQDLNILKTIYIKEINALNKGIWKHYKDNNLTKYNEKLSDFLESKVTDQEEHLIKISEYLIRNRRMRLCLILDNADQLDLESQHKAFLFCHSLSRRAKCAIVISLREGYYYKWRTQPPFDAFSNNVYHVSAPPYKDVLQKRMNYALDKLRLKKDVRSDHKDKFIVISEETILKFFTTLNDTLFLNKNTEMLQFLERTSYPNIRQGLETLKSFLISGHTNIQQYVMSDYNKVPIWEFVKAIGLDNKNYYNSETSPIHNVFQPQGNNKSHFTKIRILKYLLYKTEKFSFYEKYATISELELIFLKIGYSEDVLKAEISSLLDFKLIETDEQHSDVERSTKDNDINQICLSMSGHYYLEELVNKFLYIDLVLQDTSIFDPVYFDRMRKVFPLANLSGNRELSARKQVAEMFVEYLQIQESKELPIDPTDLDPVLTYSVVADIKSKAFSLDIMALNRTIAHFREEQANKG